MDGTNLQSRWGVEGEFYTFQFAAAPRSPPPTQQSGLPQKVRVTEPDDKVLREIYTEELIWRVPRAES